MELFPDASATRFEQLEPGTLFLNLHRHRFFALKTGAFRSGTQATTMVCLGPGFPDGVQGPSILECHAPAVLSFGRGFSVFLPTDPAAWDTELQLGAGGPSGQVAMVGESAYVFATMGQWGQRTTYYFVDLRTGEPLQGLPGRPLYTSRWEIAIVKPHHPPRVLLSYPPEAAA